MARIPTDSEAGAALPGGEARPFLKWAGGKAQLLAQFEPFFPSAFQRYVEPFVGGGAVFFHLRARFPGVPCRLCDCNEELIHCYTAVRDDAVALMRKLDGHLERFLARPKDYYYQVRARHHLSDPVDRAARMIFLNKTCFNGLWRVNAKGEFNVPIGSRKKTVLYDPDKLLAASQALQGVQLAVQDFQTTLSRTGPGDFVYLDPPYDPASRTACFTSYTKDEFGPARQKELAASFRAASKRGAKLLLSNSNTPLIRELYKGCRIELVQARRRINSEGKGRGAVAEVLVAA